MFEENVVCLGTREYGRSYVQALNEITRLKQQLKDKDEKISKVIELLKNPSTIEYEMYGLECSRDIVNINLLLEILERNKEN